MKLRQLLFEISEPEENINFRKRFPKIKPKPIRITNEIKQTLKNWKDELTNNQFRDRESIEYWSKFPWKRIPPIIVADYGTGLKILDGKHRAYANFIINDEPYINALIEPNKNL